MAMGIVNDDDFAEELSRCNPPKDSTRDSNPTIEPCSEETPKGEAQIIDIKKGRGNTPAVPSVLRQIIGETALEGARARDVARAFDVSESSVSAYKVGATSTTSYHSPDRVLLEKTNSKRTRISEHASRKILQALSHVTPDKFDDLGANKLASFAKDMSAVVKNIEPRVTNINEGIVNNAPTYIFYAPRIRKEQEFEVVDVSRDEG
jgi:hypothetical protein